MDNEEYSGKVVSIKLKSGVIFQGILTNLGSEWAFLKYIPVDYHVDGYAFVSTKYISKINILDDDIFTESILKLKNIDFGTDYDFDSNSKMHLFDNLREKSSLIGIELKNHDTKYIGFITLVKEKSMRVHLISPRCEWLKEETFTYKEVRAIYYEDDYQNSLTLVLNQKSNKNITE
jgi:hypothetical protein